MGNKFILDVACGGKMFYFNKKHKNVLYIDNREANKGHNPYRKNHEVKPDRIMDFRNLDFEDETFRMVVFDPPHFKSNNKDLNIAKLYGVLSPETWKEDLKKGFEECMRVLKPEGFLVFKWNETSIKIKEILDLFGLLPLFGNKQGTKLKTHWLVYLKEKPAPKHNFCICGHKESIHENDDGWTVCDALHCECKAFEKDWKKELKSNGSELSNGL